MTSGTLYRLCAFTLTADGGNPAGVWIGDELPDPDTMQRIAADVGFSEAISKKQREYNAQALPLKSRK